MQTATRLFVLLSAAAAMAGCNGKYVNVDISHIYTDAGYLNSASSDLGHLYLWDRASGTLTLVDVLDFAPGNMTTNDTGTSRKLKNTSGASVAASTDGIKNLEAAIEAEVDNRLSVEVEDYTVRSARSTITEMSSRIRSNPEDTADRWFLEKAFADSNRFRYVLAYKALNSQRASLEIDNTAKTEAKLKLNSVGGGITANLKGGALDEFKGTGVPSFLVYYVFRPTYNENNNYDFDVVTTQYRQDLIDALRNSSI